MRTAVIVIGLLGIVASAFLDRGALPDGYGPATPAAIAVVVGGAVATVRSRWARVGGALLAAAAAVPSAMEAVAAVGTGLPGPSTGVLATASALVVGAAAARAIGPDPRPSSRVAIGAAAAAATGLIAGGGLLVGDLPVRSTTADPVVAAATPDRPTGVRWRFTTVDGVRTVRAAGAGVVVSSGDRLTGLDGATGRERWAYARIGTRVDEVAVSPDGRTVAVAHRAGDTRRTTVLDALTGRPLWALRGTPITISDTVLLSAEPGRGRVVRDLRSGAQLWTRIAPEDCNDSAIAPPAALGAVPVLQFCEVDGGDVIAGSLVGLDERTGAQRWSVPLPPDSPGGLARLEATAAGNPLLLTVGLARSATTVVDVPTGRTIAVHDDPPTFRPLSAAWPTSFQRADDTFDAIDPATGALVAVPPGCRVDYEGAALVTATTVLRLCGKPDEERALQVGTDPPLPLEFGRGRDEIAQGGGRLVAAPGAVVVAVTGRSDVLGLA